MAETRKHLPVARDDLDRALFAALGEPVRPFQPGAKDQPEASDAEADAPETPPAKPSTLGAFTFRTGPRPS